MEKSSTIIATSGVSMVSKLYPAPQRLTPTGKISHAKTRVYTQRYRKEWEQMPDFKGWLSSVPNHPTRAYCRFCKKDLHAHRLSLLKHTCTMKHQRAALLLNSNKKATENFQTEQQEDNDDDAEYVVERLDLDEDDTQEKLNVEPAEVHIQEIEQKESSNDLCLQLQLSDEEEHKPVIKKIELSEGKCHDALAEAMAHVHGEYLEVEEEDENNVELEMVVEEEAPNPEIEVILPDLITDEVKEKSKQLEIEKIPRHLEFKAVDKKSAEKFLQTNNKGDVIVASLPVLETTYQLNNSISSTQDGNIMPTTSTQNRTITLTSGGKTLTLTGGTFQPGTQYVLSKIKGAKLPTLVMADKKPIVAINQSDTNKTVQLTTMVESTTASNTNELLDKKISSWKTRMSRKLRISTHVVDITKGLPVSGLQVSLYKLLDGRWTFINESNTNANGRCVDLLEHSSKSGNLGGRYKIHFDVDKYFTLKRIETMYPFIEIVFDVKNSFGCYHIPVLLSPFGYSTYRGF